MRIAAIVSGVVVALIAFYVVSAGPVLWLIAHGYLPVFVARIYNPVWNLPVVGDFIQWEIRQMP